MPGAFGAPVSRHLDPPDKDQLCVARLWQFCNFFAVPRRAMPGQCRCRDLLQDAVPATLGSKLCFSRPVKARSISQSSVTEAVNLHSKVTRCDHLKLIHLRCCKAPRRATCK